MQEPVLISKKVCMLGAYGVGKTSLVRQFVYKKFEEKYLSTIGVQISQKLLPPLKNPENGRLQQFKFILWDLAHIEKFNNVIRNYFRGAHGALIVFDLTRPELYSDFQVYLDPFVDMNNCPLVFVGNKIDLIDDEPQASQTLRQLAKDYEAPLLLTSAKTGENVETAFLKLAQRISTKA